MKKILPLVILVAILVFACETMIKIQMYSSDLLDLSLGKQKELFVNARIDNEVSEEDFDEAKEILVNNFREVKNIRLEEGDIYERIIADYKVPIVLEANYKQSEIDLFTIVIKPINDKKFEIGLAFNKDLYEDLNFLVEDIFMGSLSFDESNISFDFQNDIEQPIVATWKSVYLDGLAVPISHSSKLSKRDNQFIELSEVFLNSLESDIAITYFGEIEIQN